MKQIAFAEVRDHLSKYLVEAGEEVIVITKHGKPVAKLLPIEVDSTSLIGCLAGKIKISGDIDSTGVKWNAES